MTNENLTVECSGVRDLKLMNETNIRRFGHHYDGQRILVNSINLIKSQQSRIELLKSAIREFVLNVEKKGVISTEHIEGMRNLRNLMENEK